MKDITHEELVAEVHLIKAIENFADYLQSLQPTMTQAENLTLRSLIIFALPQLYEANPPMRAGVDDMVKQMRGEA